MKLERRTHVLVAAFAVTCFLSCLLPATAEREFRPRPGRREGPRPRKPRDDRDGKRREPRKRGYSIEQAVSNRAQLHTIAFSGLAFMTGDPGSCTFIPPGKVADFFGFQYMRDIDAAGKGHNPIFLDRVAGNVMYILSDKQRSMFERAARNQEEFFRAIALKRFPLIRAFHQELTGDIPAGSAGLSKKAVMKYTGEIFELDAQLAYQRAEVFGALAASLTGEQKEYLGKMKFGDYSTWPDMDVRNLRGYRPRGATKLVSVGYMTLASEFFSWYAGTVKADTYFCPERHGTYFGGFYMKDMPAMGKRDFDISTSLTGDSGAMFLESLTPEQRAHITGIIKKQGKALMEIVEVRRAISTKLRGFLKGVTPARKDVLDLGRKYGELDGELSYYYTTAFAKVYRTLSQEQKKNLVKLRNLDMREDGTAFIYSDRIRSPKVPDTSFLFGVNGDGN
ncbi:MAG: hypothetical protein QGF00_19225 [Planctomycetota bacterium]|jgi:hypothetical protein|nr:hypothetical protein [Planctomycetota bacterium]MDP7251749.1 hypothetical protein [Planctomycetota bacterium]